MQDEPQSERSNGVAGANFAPPSLDVSPLGRAAARLLLAGFTSWILSRAARFTPAQRRMRASLGAIPSLNEAITQFARELEARFLAIGNTLQAQVGHADNLVQASKRFTELQSGIAEEGHPISGALALALGTLEFIDASRTKNQELLALLERERERLLRLQATESQWQRTLAPLQTIQTLFRIEASRLSEEARSFFGALTSGIAHLHAEVTGALGQKFAALAVTRQNLDRVIAEIRGQLEQQARGLEHRERMRATLAAMQEHLQGSQARYWALLDTANRLASEVSKVVVAMQFQDIMRQKLEHVSAALVEIGQEHAASDRAALALASELQVRQVRSIRADLDKARAAIQGGFQHILQAVDEIRTQAFSSGEAARIETEVNGMVELLSKALDDTGGLMAQYATGLEHTTEVVGSFGSVAATVTRTVRRLAADIRITALNAQIEATRVDTATGLEVLTEYTRQLSQETDQFSDAMGREGSSLCAELSQAEALCAQQRRLAQEKCDVFASGGAGCREKLEAHQEDVGRVLREITEQITRIAAEVEAARPGADDKDWGAGCLDSLEATLASWVAATGGGASLARAAANAGRFQHLHQAYTMESERAVHEEVLGLRKPPSAPAAKEAFNVELFDSPPAPVSAPTSSTGVELFDSPAPVSSSQSADTGVELFDSPAPTGVAVRLEIPMEDPTAKPSQAAPFQPKPNLGDNVELF